MNPEEKEETTEKAAEKPATSARLGKEATIGAAVILGLLVILVIAIVVRVSGSGPREKVVAANDAHERKDKPKSASLLKDDKLFEGFNTKPFTPSKPAVTPASAPPHKPPTPVDKKPDPWKFASDGPDVRRPLPGDLPPGKLLKPEPPRSPAAGAPEHHRADPFTKPAVPAKRADDRGIAMPGDRGLADTVPPPPSRSRYEPPRRDDPWPASSPAPTAPARYGNPERQTAASSTPSRYGNSDRPAVPSSDLGGDDWRREPPKSRYGDSRVADAPVSPVSTRQSYGSSRTYIVVEGDTLFNIARYELGKASRWVEIYELNRNALGTDLSSLPPGIKLMLPEGERPNMLAEPPSNGYRR
ncbi:MAG: hypothetical protein LLG00_00755 [Planctomycetaceae bacterium]|nr:hypothetical protein [Planctomycetaceae bacterium]